MKRKPRTRTPMPRTQKALEGPIIWSKDRSVVAPDDYIKQLWAENQRLTDLLRQSLVSRKVINGNFRRIVWLLVRSLGGNVKISAKDLVPKAGSGEDLIELRSGTDYILMAKGGDSGKSS